MSELPRVVLYTDGACPIDGKRAQCGGWANITLWNGQEIVRLGREYPSTSSRMELVALIDGLQALLVPCEVVFYSDSQYLVKGVNEWLDGWIKRGWRRSDRAKLANQDLWEKIAASRHIHSVKGVWIAGHIGPYYAGRTAHHTYNERCDQMAVQQSLKMSLEKQS